MMFSFFLAKCPTGTAHDPKSSTCKPCAIGSYQGGTGHSECEICPKMMTTEKVGAKTIADCVGEWVNL